MPGNFVPIVKGPPQTAQQQSKTSNKINVLSGSAGVKLGAIPLVAPTEAPHAGSPPPATSPPSFAAMAPHAGQNHGAPKITFQKDGERITQIRVQCPCGQIIELNCVY